MFYHQPALPRVSPISRNGNTNYSIEKAQILEIIHDSASSLHRTSHPSASPVSYRFKIHSKSRLFSPPPWLLSLPLHCPFSSGPQQYLSTGLPSCSLTPYQLITAGLNTEGRSRDSSAWTLYHFLSSFSFHHNPSARPTSSCPRWPHSSAILASLLCLSTQACSCLRSSTSVWNDLPQTFERLHPHFTGWKRHLPWVAFPDHLLMNSLWHALPLTKHYCSSQ